MASYKKIGVKGRLHELFASLLTVEDTEIIPCAHGEAHQAETEIILSEFMVEIQDGWIYRQNWAHPWKKSSVSTSSLQSASVLEDWMVLEMGSVFKNSPN